MQEEVFAQGCARSIYICQQPGGVIMFGGEFYRNTEIITKSQVTIKKIGFPNGYDASKGSH